MGYKEEDRRLEDLPIQVKARIAMKAILKAMKAILKAMKTILKTRNFIK
jgi:hypothetical protein